MVKENEMVMLSEIEYEILEKEAKDADVLRTAIIKLLRQFKSNPTEDIEVTRKEFISIYNAAVDDMLHKEENSEYDDQEIYGYDVTVHWHGLYCNCEDGATVTHTVIDGVEVCSCEIGD